MATRAPSGFGSHLAQARMREAEAERLVDQARQPTKALRVGVGDRERKEQDR